MKSVKDYGLIIKGNKILLIGGRRALGDGDLLAHLKTQGYDNYAAIEIIDQLTEEAKNANIQKSAQDGFKRRDFSAQRREILENSVYKKNLKTRKQTIDKIFGYIKHPLGWIPLGILNKMTPKDLHGFFSQKYENELSVLKDDINDLAAELNGPEFTHAQIAEMFMEDIQPLSERHFDPFLMNSTPYNLLLEGDERPSLVYLPFNKEAKPELNSYLKGFLDSMSDHEYFCAYLYCNFLGILVQQVLYIYGEGGDGKSSFLNMLEHKTKSLGAYTEGSNAAYDMIDKSIITLAESVEKHILQKAEVKKLTGRDPLSINGKYKEAYSGKIRGLLIIHANCKPNLLGDEAEIRRLRLFNMTPSARREKIIAPEEFEILLGENFDGFLSYCKECYTKLKEETTDSVKNPSSMDVYHKQLRDGNMVTLYDRLLQKLKEKRVVVDSQAQTTEKELRSIIYNITIRIDDASFREKFFTNKFLEYLKNDMKCKFDGFGNVFGIGMSKEIPEESTGHTRVVKKLSP